MRYGILLIFLLLPWWSAGEPLPVSSDTRLTQLLNNVVLLAQTPQSSNMLARVFRLQAQGECDGSAASCPTSTLYIAVSELGEAPEQQLYQLPAAYDWEFVQWVSLPATGSPPSQVIFQVKSKTPRTDAGKPWWAEETYNIKVNYQTGSWEKIKNPE